MAVDENRKTEFFSWPLAWFFSDFGFFNAETYGKVIIHTSLLPNYTQSLKRYFSFVWFYFIKSFTERYLIEQALLLLIVLNQQRF